MTLLARFVDAHTSLVNYVLLEAGYRLADVPGRLSWWDVHTVVEGDPLLARAWAAWLTTFITSVRSRDGVNVASDIPGEDFTDGTYVKRGGSTAATWEEIEAFCA